MDCIVTLGWGGVAWAQPGGHDTAEWCVLGRSTGGATRSARVQGRAVRARWPSCWEIES